MRLILPFLLVTLFLNVPLKWLSGYWKDSPSLLYDIACGQFLLMGNSHLWFVVSLFWVFICSDVIIKWQNAIGRHHHFIVISILVFANLMSVFFYYDYLGIPNALQYLLYFYLGYYLLPMINSGGGRFSIVIILLSFVVWFFFQTIHNRFMLAHESSLLVQTFNSFLDIVGAVGASVSCCFLCKYLCQKGVKGGVFRNKTYELYLYSDPFNYLLILLTWNIFGEMVLTDNLIAVMAFLVRFFGSLAFALIVIYVVKLFRLKEIGKLIFA